MSNGVEALELGKDWLATADFNSREIDTLLGGNGTRGFYRASFNWIATYLIEEVGIYESELTDWFRSRMRRLGDRTPLEAWGDEDGFDQVYEEARVWAEQTAEDLIDEPELDYLARQRLAVPAIMDTATIFRNALISEGVELTLEESAQGNTTLWDRREENPVVLSWKTGGNPLEGYRATIPEGEGRYKVLSIVLWNQPDGRQEVVQARVTEASKDHPEDDHVPSDLDPWPTRADLEPFVSRIVASLHTKELQLVA